MEVQSAIVNNLKYQKRNKKDMFTKPKIFNLIENYISTKELICYGGTAINAHLKNKTYKSLRERIAKQLVISLKNSR